MPYFSTLLLLAVAHSTSLQTSSSVCEKDCDCQGEFKFTNCSSVLFTHIPSDIPPSTEHLDLSWNRLSRLPAGTFRALRRLRVLLLNDNNISDVAGGVFSPLESLQRLDLSRNRVSSLREGFSLGLGSLKELLLGENQLTCLDGFLHLDSLQRLNLSGNAISSIRPRAFGHMTSLRQLYLQDNRLGSLTNGDFSMLRYLEVLHLQGNRINSTEAGVFAPLTSLALLDLARNRLSAVRFKTFLSIHSYSTHVLLADNPWSCDCDLQRVFGKLRSVQRLFLDDYHNLSCREPDELRGYRLSAVDSELCVAETVTVLIITLTVLITVVAAVVMAEKTRKKQTGKHLCEESSVVYNYQS
ncbi:insulin-like growth factor-binding protein complex acid labile subunit [Conger conger]|uniref:insulin-like growth factor-binding protein complex acid labile subunit n=1 Tax=Conger conger TaxID=82655 RepID=UPI002A5A0D87|nr:insulin-like growth factor-binding protein complex acid labile subunit [Conger conger]